MSTIQHWIDGRPTSGSSTRTSTVWNPATGKPQHELLLAEASDVDAAVQAAAAAFETWGDSSLSTRTKVLFAFRELVNQRAGELAQLITDEHGKVLSDAAGEVQRGLEVVEFACGIPTLLKGGYSDQVSTGVDLFSFRQPLGVCVVDAMRRELNKLPIDGTIVIGEGERDEAPMLFIGETVGNKHGPRVDIAVDPLEGTTLCAKNMPGAIATMAMAEGGTLLNAPDVYMEKIAIGPGYPIGLVDLDAPAEENIRRLAEAKGVQPSDITALILDRPRHGDLIASVRKVGAAVRLITAGDVAGVIHTADPTNTGIDIYIGVGGAPEGVLAAAALRCIGGQMQCRLVLDTQEKRGRAAKMGIKDPRKKYEIADMVQGDCLFAATGVTDGALLDGVRFRKNVIETETVVMRSVTGTVRWIRAEHRQREKFYLD